MMKDVNSIIAANVGLIRKQLGKFKLTTDPEAESIAYEALYNAVRTYRESSGTKFSTYATVCIYNALGTYIRSINKKRQLEVISYNAIVYDNDGADTEYLDLIPAANNVEDLFVQADNLRIIHRCIDEVVGTLTEKQRKIVKYWQGTEYKISTTDLSKALNISQSYVSQTLTTFKNKLRKKLKEELL